MSPQTLTSPPTDRGMWRRLLARAHPDSGGSHELFLWVSALQEHVLSGLQSGPTHWGMTSAQYAPPNPADGDGPAVGERVPFSVPANFERLTLRALNMSEEVEEVYARLLRLLADCFESYEPPLSGQQQRGATYRSIAALCHRAGMTKAERTRFYRICEDVPLSQRHIGHMLAKLQRKAA
jgi:hypothetical protein